MGGEAISVGLSESALRHLAWCQREVVAFSAKSFSFKKKREWEMSLESEFHEAMLNVYKDAGAEVHYWANYFLRDVKKLGGLACAKKMLRKSLNGEVQKGFQALIDVGRADISMEALVVDPKFSVLFTPEEILEAKKRLHGLPTIGSRLTVTVEELYPDEVDDQVEFQEGTLKTVKINVFERNPQARAACLKKYGYDCFVCGINFEKVYGDIGKNFIHVHHKKPLALVRATYKLNPLTDLIPVCPNCHAMLHTTDPPKSPIELRKLLRRHS